MITKGGQRWTVGERVNVGFLRDLRVVAAVPTPGDWAPDAYELVDDRNGRTYRFVPHKGIERTN
jgi:hypothetical protein